jgi:hypothetical protein
MEMARTVTCRIVDCPDGRFAVEATLGSGSVHRHGGLSTMAEAEEAVETLRVLMEACGSRLLAQPGTISATEARPAFCTDRSRR